MENEELTKIHSLEEIKEAVWSLYPLKAPGLDEFPSIFYRTYWDVVEEHIDKYVHESFRTSIIAKGMNKTFIVLIPKKKCMLLALRTFGQSAFATLLIKWFQRLLPTGWGRSSIISSPLTKGPLSKGDG